jgi:hypothetical protein
MGARVLAGIVAGEDAGPTHAIVWRYVDTDHPPAAPAVRPPSPIPPSEGSEGHPATGRPRSNVVGPVWHGAQALARIGATSTSNAGDGAGVSRSCEQPTPWINARMAGTAVTLTPGSRTGYGRIVPHVVDVASPRPVMMES